MTERQKEQIAELFSMTVPQVDGWKGEGLASNTVMLQISTSGHIFVRMTWDEFLEQYEKVVLRNGI